MPAPARSTAVGRAIAILQDRRLVDKEQEFTGQTVIQKLFDEIAPKFADRQGGYTRIIKLSDYRIGDGGSLVLLCNCWTEESTVKPTGGNSARRSADLRAIFVAYKHQFAGQILKKHKEGASTAAAAPVAEGSGEPAAS